MISAAIRLRRAAVVTLAACLGAGGHALLARAQSRGAAAPNALTAAPNEYQLEFENDYVRVTRITYPAHHKAPMHSHSAPGGVIVALTDQDARVTGPDGSTRELHYKGGQARWAVATPGADQ